MRGERRVMIGQLVWFGRFEGDVEVQRGSDEVDVVRYGGGEGVGCACYVGPGGGSVGVEVVFCVDCEL